MRRDQSHRSRPIPSHGLRYRAGECTGRLSGVVHRREGDPAVARGKCKRCELVLLGPRGSGLCKCDGCGERRQYGQFRSRHVQSPLSIDDRAARASISVATFYFTAGLLSPNSHGVAEASIWDSQRPVTSLNLHLCRNLGHSWDIGLGARFRWAARADDEPPATEGGDPSGTYKRWFGRVSGRAGWWRGSSLVGASYWPGGHRGMRAG